MADEKPKVVPGMNRFKQAGTGFMWGAVGGGLSGLGMAFLGAPIGTAAGALVAAAIIGGDSGKTIATIGGFEAAQALFIGGPSKE